MQHAPVTYRLSNVAAGNYRINLMQSPTPGRMSSPKASPRSPPTFAITLSPPSEPPTSSESNSVSLPDPVDSPLTPVSYTVVSVTCPYPQTRQLELVRTSPDPSQSSSTPFVVPIPSHISITLPSSFSSSLVKRQYTPIAHTATSLTLLVRTYTPAQLGSHYLASLTVGSTLSVSGPFSAFPHRLSCYDNLALICMGSGITPMMQLLASLTPASSTSSSSPRPLLLYCCRTEADIWLRPQLASLSSVHPRASVVFQLSQPSDSSWPHQGRLDERALREVLDDWGLGEGGEGGRTLFCLCGSDEFCDSVKGLLEGVWGVDGGCIHVF